MGLPEISMMYEDAMGLQLIPSNDGYGCVFLLIGVAMFEGSTATAYYWPLSGLLVSFCAETMHQATQGGSPVPAFWCQPIPMMTIF